MRWMSTSHFVPNEAEDGGGAHVRQEERTFVRGKGDDMLSVGRGDVLIVHVWDMYPSW
jgi:hypothetical protein